MSQLPVILAGANSKPGTDGTFPFARDRGNPTSHTTLRNVVWNVHPNHTSPSRHRSKISENVPSVPGFPGGPRRQRYSQCWCS